MAGVWEVIYWVGLLAYFLAVAFTVAEVAVVLCRRFAWRYGILDLPGGRKIHDRAVPLLGGVGVYLAFYTVIIAHGIAWHFLRDTRLSDILLAPVIRRYAVQLDAEDVRQLFAIFSGSTLIMLLGLLDDVFNLSVFTRLLLQTIVAGVTAFVLDIRPVFFHFPPLVVGAIAVVWIVGITNSFNLLDGMNGLAAGTAAIVSLILALVAVLGRQPYIAMLLVVLAGALLGFLRFNFPRASIFLGSAGSMLVGYLLSVTVLTAAFMVPGKSRNVAPVVMPILIMGVPLYDTASVVLIRLWRGERVTQGDQNHIAHRLVRLGFTSKQAVLFLYLMTFCVGINATLLVNAGWYESGIILVQILATIGIIVVLERVRAPGGDA
jgi:UDP-GlcNAc:undecaprenyl-phosphate GlcNAc-1-phosphate transferase